MSNPLLPDIPIESLATMSPPGMIFPNNFSFVRDDARLLYLAATPTNLNQQLYVLNIETGEKHIAVTPPGEGTQEDKLSPEEVLRRQRERNLALGITSFVRSKSTDRLLIPLSGSIYVQDEPDTPLRKVVDAGNSPAITPTFSPDGTKIAYVQDSELYVVPAGGGTPKRITYGAREMGKTNGLAEYIAQEELGRSMGYWWSPDSKWLVYAHVDETHIPVYRIMHQGKNEVGDAAQEDHRYPFAGAANAAVYLGVISAEGGETVWLDLNLGHECYVARVFWWNDGSPGAQLLNREQTRLDLVKFNPQTGARKLILREVSPYWVTMRHTHFVLFKTDQFVWASERSGYNHLYYYEPDGELIRQVTNGEWAVDDIEGLDETNGVIYFTANRESPLEKHLYCLPMIGGEMRRLTPESGTHHVTLSNNFTRFVDVFHNVETPPTVTLRSTTDSSAIHTLHTPNDPRLDQFKLTPPELVSLPNRDGTTLYGAIYRPPTGQEPFPTIVHVYGGPGPQLVANSWLLTCAMQLQYLSRQGYLVFRLDNRGSARRGLEFEGALRHKMGTVEVDDQVDGVRWLIAQGLTDAARVGVTGWSYGGYMTLMCLAKAADVFKVGVAGAPVTDWDGYDTAYTERYMGTPRSNPQGYQQGSVLSCINQLGGKLLLVHGLIDENVHFRHTARLMNVLNRARKPYDVLIFPDERHMPRRVDDRTYMQERIVAYFKENL